MNSSETKYVSEVVQAAKLIRADLKASFPGIKFRVVTKSYSMGNSINIYWTDGPTRDSVKPLVAKYKDGDFDGMDDSYTYRPNPENTPRAKYLFCNRELSDNAREAINLLKVERYGDSFLCALEENQRFYQIADSLSF